MSQEVNFNVSRLPFRYSKSFNCHREESKTTKSAAELLEASKSLYVKSESVLGNRQEWLTPTTTKGAIRNDSKPKLAHLFFATFLENQSSGDERISTLRLSPSKKTPPPVPPKSRKVLTNSQSANFPIATNCIDKKSPTDQRKPPIPPKPKKLTKQASPVPLNTQLSKMEPIMGSKKDDLKSCLISLISPDGAKLEHARNRAETYPLANDDERKRSFLVSARNACGSSPNLANLPITTCVDIDIASKLKIEEPDSQLYNKRRKSMPNLRGCDAERSRSTGRSGKKIDDEDGENSTVGADDGSESARWDISVISTAGGDNMSEKSGSEPLTWSPRRQVNFSSKRITSSFPSAESDNQLNKHLATTIPATINESSVADSEKSTSTLHKFFNSMGLDQNVWQKINSNLVNGGRATAAHTDGDSVQYFSSVPSSVTTFSRSSESTSEGHRDCAGQRRKSTKSTETADDNLLNAAHSSKPISVIERNARVIKWIYACGKGD